MCRVIRGQSKTVLGDAVTRVFLLNPPGDIIRTGRLVRKSKISTQSWPPIFLAYATGVLEKLGYECKLYDASILGKNEIETLTEIKSFKPDMVAVYWSYDTREKDLAYAEALARFRRVILVGPWSAHYPEALSDCPHVEAMTFGQFEYSLPKLIESEKTEGVKYRTGEFVKQRDPYSTSELDWMPFVSDVYKSHLPVSAYHQTSFRHPFVDIFTARSCPHRCAFCSWINGMDCLHPQRYQMRSLNNVMDELYFIKHELPDVKQVFFQDSTLTAKRAIEISQKILDEKLHICWGAYSRADKDYETLKLMKDAGCRTLHVGYEVPIQSILDEIRKDLTVKQLSDFASAIKKAGMWISSSFMIFPWMSKEQILFMVDWIKKSDATRINVAQLQEYPHCPIVDVRRAHEDIPASHMMSFDEMRQWEQFCFKEFYVKNPKFWWNVATNPLELKHVISDAFGMLKFLGE